MDECKPLITDSEITLESCLSLQPKTGGGDSSGKKTEALVNTIIDDMLQQVPGPYNHEKLMQDKAGRCTFKRVYTMTKCVTVLRAKRSEAKRSVAWTNHRLGSNLPSL